MMMMNSSSTLSLQSSERSSPSPSPETRVNWGVVLAGETVRTLRERSMITLALLAATKNFDEIPMHIRATANTGASREDVMEALLHVAIYAGVPRANHAIKIAKETFAQMDQA